MNSNGKILFLQKHGFEIRPEAGSRCYPFLVIDHNQNSEKLYFNNVDQAHKIINRWYLPKESNMSNNV